MTTTSTLATTTLVVATLMTAMVAGLLFCFAHSVMPGLMTLDDRSLLIAFQRIDAAIANPAMMVTFLGSPVLVLGSLLLHLPGRGPVVAWLLVALVLSAATVVVTGVVHLPINAAIQDAAPAFVDAADLRHLLEDRWVRWNLVRVVTSTGSLAALCWALVLSGRSAG